MTESDRIARFEAAYNRIDHALTLALAPASDRRKFGFAAKVRILASRRKRVAQHTDALLEMGELRNALVHSRTGEATYIAVPSEPTVLLLEQIERDVFSPEKVAPRFLRNVLSVRTSQSLADVWQMIRDDGYSRYPVYDAGRFVGLLTSNGFARWCAAQLRNGRIEIDAARATVADVLAKDHRREAVRFVSRDALIDSVRELFADIHPLEAVIITDHAQPDEKPLGLVCAGDIASRKSPPAQR